MAQLNLTPNDNPDWSKVIELLAEYIELLTDPDTVSDTLSDFDADVFEAALESVYGAGVFDRINPILNEL